MSPGGVDRDLVRRHLMALDAAVQTLRAHTGRPAELLRTDVEEAWIVQRGLHLCAQNCLDVATHIAAAAGLDVPEYVAAIDGLARLGSSPTTSSATSPAEGLGGVVVRRLRPGLANCAAGSSLVEWRYGPRTSRMR